MENRKQQLLAQREQLMSGICEMELSKLNLKNTLADLDQRLKFTLQDLVNVVNELNKLLEEEAKGTEVAE